MRRIRAILETTLLWTVGWVVAMAVITVMWFSWRGLWVGLTLRDVRALLLGYALWGAVSGVVFAVIVAVAERHRYALDELSRARFALWGAIGASSLPLMALTWNLVSTRSISALSLVGPVLGAMLGAVFGHWCLALARRELKRVGAPATATLLNE